MQKPDVLAHPASLYLDFSPSMPSRPGTPRSPNKETWPDGEDVTADQRVTIRYLHGYGLSTWEIAALMHKSETTIRRAVRDGEILMEFMKDEEMEESDEDFLIRLRGVLLPQKLNEGRRKYLAKRGITPNTLSPDVTLIEGIDFSSPTFKANQVLSEIGIDADEVESRPSTPSPVHIHSPAMETSTPPSSDRAFSAEEMTSEHDGIAHHEEDVFAAAPPPTIRVSLNVTDSDLAAHSLHPSMPGGFATDNPVVSNPNHLTTEKALDTEAESSGKLDMSELCTLIETMQLSTTAGTETSLDTPELILSPEPLQANALAETAVLA
ncbi:hypothetical protein CALVIDRAFT_597849 [Calocera viscosa TUFC12733]|uniref:Uncharacterized protein n=1 Tax=Calocera viscosa (strain TUFC12733) TaxID=1330018 RepID=A0A167MWK1_CALVF|nr:hypothetical protein CALVIDRAFT_597849 [Calocera viscosa TUFC12733]